MTDFIFLGSKTTADGDCSHEIKRRLLLGRKVKTKHDSILKSRDITLPDSKLADSKITADDDCSHQIKRRLLLGRKVMTNHDSILKSRDITLPTKVHLVKATVFPVVMYRWESWTIKSLSTKELMLQTIVLEKTDAEAEAPILWPSDSKRRLSGKDSDLGKD